MKFYSAQEIALLVEAAPWDIIGGIGLGKNNPMHGTTVMAGEKPARLRSDASSCRASGVAFASGLAPSAEELGDSFARATDDRAIAADKDRALKKLTVAFEDVDNGSLIANVIICIEPQFLELGIFADEILNRPIKDGNQRFQCSTIGSFRFFHIENC